jgi:hypothetical protein
MHKSDPGRNNRPIPPTSDQSATTIPLIRFKDPITLSVMARQVVWEGTSSLKAAATAKRAARACDNDHPPGERRGQHSCGLVYGRQYKACAYRTNIVGSVIVAKLQSQSLAAFVQCAATAGTPGAGLTRCPSEAIEDRVTLFGNHTQPHKSSHRNGAR